MYHYTGKLGMSERIKNVDGLRFILIILIVLYHAKNISFGIGHTLKDYLPGIIHCDVCVDFFFIIAGFFLFYNQKKETDTFKYATKRFLRLAPLIWFFILCTMIISIFINNHFSFDGNILRIFLMNNIGFGGTWTGGDGCNVSWFVSVLFWVSLFYFYIAKIFEKKYLNLIIWMIIVFSLGYYLNWHKFTTGAHTPNIYYVLNVGVLRGLTGLGIGYFINELYQNRFLQNISKKGNVVLSGLEIFLSGFLGYFLIFTDKLPGKSSVVYIVIFSILLYLFLIRKGVLSKLLNNNVSTMLGSYTYAIYVMHPLILNKSMKFLYPENSYTGSITIIICCIIIGILTHYIFEKPINKFIQKAKS